MATQVLPFIRAVWRCVIPLIFSLAMMTCSVAADFKRSPTRGNSDGSSNVWNSASTIQTPQRSAGHIVDRSGVQADLRRRKLLLREHAYVAACVLVKDEHRYIREWIRYHLTIGLEKFYIFDHMSSPPISTVVEDYVREGYAEVFYFSDSWEQDSNANVLPMASRRHASPQVLGWNTCAAPMGGSLTCATE